VPEVFLSRIPSAFISDRRPRGSPPARAGRSAHLTLTQLFHAEVVAHFPAAVPSEAPITEAARQIRANDIGEVLVSDGGRLAGMVTDRDIVIRLIAENNDLNTPVREACSDRDLVTLTPDMDLEEAVELMRRKAIRRLPVVESDRPVGFPASAMSPSKATRPQRWLRSAPRNPISNNIQPLR
jgi:CBS domain-containing protein